MIGRKSKVFRNKAFNAEKTESKENQPSHKKLKFVDKQR